MMTKENVMLLLAALIITVIPLMSGQGAVFGGADGQVAGVVQEINPEYRPWQEALWEPPSSEVESLLFALQAAVGAGFIGYFFGYYKGRKTQRDEALGKNHAVPRLSGLQ